jgi:predicted porin
MNKKISAAVASAALVLGATSANAGIIIPAGEWTVDINGNVNVYATYANFDDTTAADGGLAGVKDSTGEDKDQGIGTGLLPAWLGITATTRQNDLDVSWTISMQPNVSENNTMGDSGDIVAWRQAFITFGDKSWGSVKMGKDLGIFAANAILSDMTLLGVGSGAAHSGGNFTNGHIGTGYIYPAWKGQIAYTTPNMNGFSATLAITNPNGSDLNTTAISSTNAGSSAVELYQDRFGIEGQVQYEWTGDVAGKVWASGASYDVNGATNTADQSSSTDIDSYTASAFDIGVSVTSGNLGAVAYYYDGDGVGTTIFGRYGADIQSSKFKKRDSDGGYVQLTYVIPTGTKLGFAYGVSNLDKASGETADSQGTSNGTTNYLVEKNERWTVGAYHPLTKHLNLVAEYNKVESEAHRGGVDYDADTVSLGAILFF